MDKAIKDLRDVVRERRNEAIRAVADSMPDGGKYEKIAELLSAYGIPISPVVLATYASKARKRKL